MFLRNLSLFNFRNYSEMECSFSAQANALTGLNGSGKTNILDAIHYLCLCKSYFHSSDALSIKHESDFFSIHGVFDKNDSAEEIFVGMKTGGKKTVKRNLKEYGRISEHIGLFPVVMVAPNDQELITGSGENRRRFIDGIICQFHSAYLDNLVQYNKAMQQRNALLRQLKMGGQQDWSLLALWDEQLAGRGSLIHAERKAFIARFEPKFSEYYRFLAGEKEEVSLLYKSQLNEHELIDLLSASHQKDLALQYTSAGIHKDDLELQLNHHSVRKIGSQGQQKSFVLAMKLAQFEIMRQESGMKPILLLDDIFDKLDLERTRKLMELVSRDTFGQLFITDTSDEHISQIFKSIQVPLKVFKLTADENGLVIQPG